MTKSSKTIYKREKKIIIRLNFFRKFFLQNPTQNTVEFSETPLEKYSDPIKVSE